MIREDFILRQVRLLTEALTRILFLKRSGRTEEAIAEVEMSGKLVGARSGLPLSQLDPDEIVSLASTSESLHIDSALTLFNLLVQAADLYEHEQQREERDASAVRAIRMALAISEAGSSEGSIEMPATVDKMVRICRIDALENETINRLLTFYENTGLYGRAEDMLFILEDRKWEGVFERGVKFFGRLEKMTPTRLRKGNLILREVYEDRRAFNARHSAPNRSIVSG